MKLIAGLGNPGLKYKNTRHNIGFIVVEKLAEELGVRFSKKQYNALVGAGKIDSKKVILLKPLTYMNLSGLSVKALAEKNNLLPQDLLVICDDLNLPLGTLRLRNKGSDGGHNGLKSITKELGTSVFARLRVGTGSDSKDDMLSDFVLAPFAKSEKKAVKAIADTASQACLSWLNFGPEAAMNKFNKDWINYLA